ncbi:zinc finger protein OZF-like, partial [Musca vetustissima]|uniref:zinc finger protein OZF-like n=1 Tax=Musca vetustissima TaxID=27455 RepID=UPI002AB75FB1
ILRTAKETGQKNAVLCLQCWHHISDFNSFQQTVLLLHANLNETVENAVAQKPPKSPSNDNNDPLQIVPTNVMKIKPDPETITPDEEVQEQQRSQNEVKLETNLDAATSCADFDESKSFQIENAMTDDNHEFLNEDEDVEDDSDYDNSMFDEMKFEVGTLNSSNDQLLELRETGPSTSKKRKSNNSPYDDEAHCSDDQLQSRDVTTCVKCHKTFVYRTGLYHHQRRCHPEMFTKIRKTPKEIDEIIAKWKPSLNCEVCPKSFPTFTLLKSHFQAEHPNQEFFVSCCGRKLKYRFRVEEHAAIHMNPATFKCILCGNCFMSKINLKNHMEVMHPTAKLATGEDDNSAVKCSECGLSFGDEATLQEHNKIHTEITAHHCQYCIRCFDDKYALVQHMASEHPDQPNSSTMMLNTCVPCKRTFDYRSGLYHHQRRVHPEEFAKRKKKKKNRRILQSDPLN